LATLRPPTSICCQDDIVVRNCAFTASNRSTSGAEAGVLAHRRVVLRRGRGQGGLGLVGREHRAARLDDEPLLRQPLQHRLHVGQRHPVSAAIASAATIFFSATTLSTS
jgi:hypothetical protein